MLRLTPEDSKMIIQADKFDATYAGGEANVMCSLSMFGNNTKMLTKLPDNPLGEKVIRDLRAYGVDTKDIIKGEGSLCLRLGNRRGFGPGRFLCLGCRTNWTDALCNGGCCWLHPDLGRFRMVLLPSGFKLRCHEPATNL